MQDSGLIGYAYLDYIRYVREGELVFNGTELGAVDEMLQRVPEMNNGDGCTNVNILNAIKNWL